MAKPKAKRTPAPNVPTAAVEELLGLDPKRVVSIRALTKEEQEQQLLKMPPASDLLQ